VEPAVFLDRDNTLIANDGDLGDPDKVRIIDGVPAGLLALRKAGYRLVVVTNQGGVARGKFTEADVDAVHQRVASLIEDETEAEGLIDRFYYCPYHPEGTKPEYRRDHAWRKPHPGMLVQAARDMQIDLSRSWMIGDQTRDIRAGKAAGCRTVLIATDPALNQEANPTVSVSTFTQAVEAVLRRNPGAMNVEQVAASVTKAATESKAETKKPAGKESAQGEGERVNSAGEERAGRNAETKQEKRDGSRGASAVMIEPRASSRAEAEREAMDSDPEWSTPARRSQHSSHAGASGEELTDLKRAVVELAEELRSQRVHATEFTLLKLAAGACQLLVLLLVLLGLFELHDMQAFAKWFLGATLTQLVTIALLLLDMRG